MTIRTSTLTRAVVLLTAVAVVFFLLLASGAGAGNEVRATGVHVVAAGDTIWSIAAQHTQPGEDVRTTVFDIKRMNRMEESMIHTGDQLVVPLGS
ncbi:MAG: LysM peptidoglycan-binding domain-containing protein [Acidimicrobiia bacterium]